MARYFSPNPEETLDTSFSTGTVKIQGNTAADGSGTNYFARVDTAGRLQIDMVNSTIAVSDITRVKNIVDGTIGIRSNTAKDGSGTAYYPIVDDAGRLQIDMVAGSITIEDITRVKNVVDGSINVINRPDIARVHNIIDGTIGVSSISGTTQVGGEVYILGVEDTTTVSGNVNILNVPAVDATGQGDIPITLDGERADIQRVHNIVDGTVSVSSVSGTTQVGGEVYVLGVEGTTQVEGEVYVSGIDDRLNVQRVYNIVDGTVTVGDITRVKNIVDGTIRIGAHETLGTMDIGDISKGTQTNDVKITLDGERADVQRIHNLVDGTVSISTDPVNVDATGQGDVPITLDGERVDIQRVHNVIDGTIAVSGVSGTTQVGGEVYVLGVEDTTTVDGSVYILGSEDTLNVGGAVYVHSIGDRPDVQRVHNIVDGTIDVEDRAARDLGKVDIAAFDARADVQRVHNIVDGTVGIGRPDIARVHNIVDGSINIIGYGWTHTSVTATYSDTAPSDTAILNTISGKSVKIMGVLISTNTAMNVELEESNVDVIPPVHLAANGGAVISGGGILYSTAGGDAIDVTASAAGSLSVKIWGYEV